MSEAEAHEASCIFHSTSRSPDSRTCKPRSATVMSLPPPSEEAEAEGAQFFVSFS